MTINKETKDYFISILGQEKAEELLRLNKNFDGYIKRFQDSVNELLSEVGYQVRVGILYETKGEDINGD